MSNSPSPYNARYMREWRAERKANGRAVRLVDAEPTRVHIAGLLGAGWSMRSIAGEAGVSVQVISKVMKGQTLINVDSAAAITGVTGERVAVRTEGKGEPFVPRIGTVRRLQALLYMGWRWQDLRAYQIYAPLMSQQGRWVTRTNHDRVVKAYEELSMREGPSVKTRTLARNLGYLGPLAWDDPDTDPEPLDSVTEQGEEEYLDETAIIRRMAGDRSVALTIPEQVECLRRWRAEGERSDSEFERHTGINPLRVDGYAAEREQDLAS